MHAFTICNEPTNLLHKFEKENTTPPKSSIPLHWWNYLCFKLFLSMLWIVHSIKKQRVYHIVACLLFTLESILMQKKNYEISNISQCKNIIFKKNPLKETKILQDIITLQLISNVNTSQNIIFQKSSYKNRPIT